MGAGHAHVHAAGHDHDGGDVEAPVAPEVRRLLAVLLVPLAVLSLGALLLLWPDAPEPEPGQAPLPRVDATVLSVSGDAASGGEAQVRLDEGSREGARVTVRAPTGEGAPQLGPGDEVVLSDDADAPGGARYTVVDYQRGTTLAGLAVAFALAVAAFGRWSGVRALVGLVVSFGVLATFVLPAILAGTNPLLVAVVGASVTMFATLYLAHGLSARTSVAVLGTVASLAATALLASLASGLAHLTGLATEEAGFVRTLYGDVDTRGLLLAGVVIGALGVLDDVTVTQSSAVFELKRSAPHTGFRSLYGAGVRIGRDHVASTVNTLVLAYAGASLPLLVLFSGGGAPLSDVVNGELVAQEVVRSLVGGLGIVAAVPLTTGLAAYAVTRVSPRDDASPDGEDGPPDVPRGRRARAANSRRRGRGRRRPRARRAR